MLIEYPISNVQCPIGFYLSSVVEASTIKPTKFVWWFIAEIILWENIRGELKFDLQSDRPQTCVTARQNLVAIFDVEGLNKNPCLLGIDILMVVGEVWEVRTDIFKFSLP